MRSPTAPPTRSAAAARPVQEPDPEPTAVPLSIPRQTAFPDAAESTAEFAAHPAALAPAPHGKVSDSEASEAVGHSAAGPPPGTGPRLGAHARRQADTPADAKLETPGEAFSRSETADREPVRLDPARPNITVVSGGTTAEPAPTVERMLAGPSVRRGDGISGRVMVVPGGHRPGKPDQLQRDRARVQLPVSGSRRVVVLGCTVGAGQTITALMTGEVLASLRSEPITALDLNPGSSSLGQRGKHRPALAQVTSPGSPRLVILGPRPGAADETGADPADPSAGLAQAIGLFERATSGHQIVLADPSTTVVPRLLSMADQLILVAPASAAAARAISMTFEWLDAHGHADLASEAIMVMNGVSRRSTAHVEQAERGCIGRCRAIVRVPWDDQLGLGGQTLALQEAGRGPAAVVSPATAGAYTALAGVLVVALADQAGPDDDDHGEGDGEQRDPSAIARTGWGPR
jgi:MinD-like ATPase involved in chromosome partitioning or flagellar assembly